VAQLVMVVEILITQRDPEYPLTCHRLGSSVGWRRF
jgi:hypothetical protein